VSKTRLKHLLAAEKNFYTQAKIVKLYKICSNSVKKSCGVIIYTLCIDMRSQMLCTNGSFEICQERMFVKQRRKQSSSSYLLPKKIFMLYKQKSSNLYMIGFKSVRKFLSDC